MNDRYLYRAKRKDDGEWISGYLYGIWERKYILWGMINDIPNMTEVDTSTICQCTGLKDKNGKLIWENDIVRDDNGNLYKAFWQDRYYQFSWICVKSDKLPIGAKWDFWSIRNYEIEVIGSAIDNPELLEVGE